jgi:death-on-curing protein
LLHGLLSNHGFNDANKRTAWLACNTFLFIRNVSLELPPDYEWYGKLAEMVEEKWVVEQVITWLTEFVKFHDSREETLEAIRAASS